ncbi:MAG: ion transporter [Opitutales bacterium]
MSLALRADRLSHHPAFERGVLALIVMAGLLVGLETYPQIEARHGALLDRLDQLVLALFTAELLVRLAAVKGRPDRFLRSGWNVFDTVVVVLCYLPETGAFAAVARLARVLRLLRLLESVPRLQVILTGILRSLPSMGYIALLLGLLFYVYAVLGVFLFAGNDPGHFGHLGRALLSLLRIVTLEDWTDVMYTAFHGSQVYPAQGPVPVGPDPKAFGWGGVLYFASFVILGAMVMLNLFIGVVLTSLTEAHAEQLDKAVRATGAADDRAELAASLDRIERELQHLRRGLGRGDPPA